MIPTQDFKKFSFILVRLKSEYRCQRNNKFSWKCTGNLQQNSKKSCHRNAQILTKKLIPTQHWFETGLYWKWYPPNTGLKQVSIENGTHPTPIWNMGLQLDSMKCDTHTNTGLNLLWKSTSSHSSHVWTILQCWSSRTASWLCMGMLTISSKRVLNCLTARNKSHWL